jgi:hypothetical protein
VTSMTLQSYLFVVSSMNCNNYFVVVDELRNNYVDERIDICSSVWGGASCPVYLSVMCN